MTTQKLIQAIATEALDKTFQEEIRNIYQRDVRNGEFSAEENEYAEAMVALAAVLSPEKLTLVIGV